MQTNAFDQIAYLLAALLNPSPQKAFTPYTQPYSIRAAPFHSARSAQPTFDGDPQQVTPSNVWQYHQNKAGIIIRDLEKLGIPKATSTKILMARGVFKWFAARRKIIKLKEEWRKETQASQYAIQQIKSNIHDHWNEGETTAQRQRHLQLAYERGYLAATERCRKEVRAICHSARWQCDPNDQTGSRALYAVEEDINRKKYQL